MVINPAISSTNLVPSHGNSGRKRNETRGGGCAVRWPWVWPPSAALEGGARWPAVRAADEQDSGRDGVERSGTEPIGHLTALRRTFEFSGLKMAVVIAANSPSAQAAVPGINCSINSV